MSDAIETDPLLGRRGESSTLHEDQKVGILVGDVNSATRTGAYVQWRARDNRKGRHVLIVPTDYTSSDLPRFSSDWSSIAAGIWRMCTVWAWWDVSWWVGIHFSIGCVLFVIVGFFHWLPKVAPNTDFPGEDEIAGYLIFIGATLFAFAGVLLVVEATNENQTGCFGWAVLSTLGSDDQTSHNQGRVERLRVQHLVHGDCQHLHSSSHAHTLLSFHAQHPDTHRTWEWWPTWRELTSHYFHDIGSIASFLLAIGTIVFWVSGIMALPPLSDVSTRPTMLATYWLSFLVGGILFTTSSAMYMLEAQRNWYTPNFRSLGWWAAFWNFIGSFGWILSASFGYCTADWCGVQTSLTLLWASLSFLFGSLLLWYEALEKYPVEREARAGGKEEDR